jgi:hypothetical protein
MIVVSLLVNVVVAVVVEVEAVVLVVVDVEAVVVGAGGTYGVEDVRSLDYNMSPHALVSVYDPIEYLTRWSFRGTHTPHTPAWRDEGS